MPLDCSYNDTFNVCQFYDALNRKIMHTVTYRSAPHLLVTYTVLYNCVVTIELETLQSVWLWLIDWLNMYITNCLVHKKMKADEITEICIMHAACQWPRNDFCGCIAVLWIYYLYLSLLTYQLKLNSTTRTGPDTDKVRARCRVRAKFHYTDPTGLLRARTLSV